MRQFILQFFASIAAVLFFASAVQAQTTTLIHVGSFDSASAAKNHWDGLQRTYPEILDRLEYRPAEVAVPPDNKIIYRVQAGPLADKSQADKTCNILSGNGVDCYVVETAMYAANDFVPMPAATSTTATNEMQVASATNEGGLFGLSWFDSEDSNSAADNTPTLPVIEPVDNALAIVPVLPATLDTATETIPVAAAIIPAPEIIPLPKIAPAPNAELITNNGGGLFSQPVTYVAPDAVPSRLETPAVDNPLPVKTAAVAITPEITNRVIAERAPRNLAGYVSNNAPRMNNDVRNMPVAPTPVIDLAESAPTQRLALDDIRDAAPMRSIDNQVAVMPPSAVVAVQPVVMAPPPPVNLGTVRSRNDISGARGEMVAAEAIPVPLSEQQTAPAILVEQPSEVSDRPRALGWGGLPSQNFRQQALWVELRSFDGERSAINYWNAIKQQNPSLTQNMRMRMTKPYFQRNRKNVNMRLGPFLSMADVNETCARVREQGLECGVVKDLSGTATANQERYRPYERSRDTYQQPYVRAEKALHWILLGSYDAPYAADQAWDGLRLKAPDILDRMEPNVDRPNFTSSGKPQFRLRTGPFANPLTAQRVCDDLRTRGVNCVVVMAQ